MKKPVLNEQIIKMRKMMGLNENHMDDMSNAKSNAKQQYDFYQDAIDYVGGKVEWDKLSGNEKDSVLADMEKDWDRSRNMGESNDPEEKMVSFDFEKAAIESASGEKVVQREFDDYDRPLYWSLTNDYVNYYIGDGDNGPIIIKYNAKTGENTVIGDLKDYDAPERAKDSEDNELFEGGRSDKHDDSHGSPYDRGYADAYYGRGKDPHKYPEGTYNGERVTDLSPEELDAYHSGYDGCTDSKDWGEMEEGDGPEEKMVSFDDLLAQDTDGMSPEDQAMIDAHDEEEANKYASKNYDDVESGAIDEDWGSSDQGYMNKAIHDDLNQPTEFNFGMYDDLKNAAEEAVDHFWDDWEEYNTNREGLVMKAMKLYLKRYFPDWYENASKMFS